MSKEAIAEVIGKVVTDLEYRQLLLQDPETALRDYELDDDKKAALKDLTIDSFDIMDSQMEERISRAGFSMEHMAQSAATLCIIGHDSLGREQLVRFRSFFDK